MKRFSGILGACVLAASVGVCLGQNAGGQNPGGNTAAPNAAAPNAAAPNAAAPNAGAPNAGGGFGYGGRGRAGGYGNDGGAANGGGFGNGGGGVNGGFGNAGGFGRGGAGGNFARGGAESLAENGTFQVPGIDVNFYTHEMFWLSDELTLSDSQKPALEAEVDTMNKELQTLVRNTEAPPDNPGDSGPRFGRGGRNYGGGAPANNAPAAPSAAIPAGDPSLITRQQLKLQDDFLTLADGHQIKINALLTDDQKQQWETYKLNRQMDPHLGLLGLSDDQKSKVKQLVADTARQILALKDTSGMEALRGNAMRFLLTDVLTPQQAAKWLQQPVVTPESATADPANGRGGFAGGVAGGGLAAGGAAGNFGGFGGRGGGFGGAQAGPGGAGAAGGGGGAGGRGGRGGRGFGGQGFGGGPGGGGQGGGDNGPVGLP